MSEPAPSSVPAGWWEYIGLGDGAGPKAIVVGGGCSYCTQGNLASGPKPPLPRTSKSDLFLVERPTERLRGVPPHGPLLNPWSWAGAADERWARRPRRSSLGDVALARPDPRLSLSLPGY